MVRGLRGALLLLAVAGGCVGGDPDLSTTAPDRNRSDGGTQGTQGDSNGDGGIEAGNAPTELATLTLDPPRPRVRAGSSSDVTLSIERRGLEGEIAVSIEGLPAGVTANAATIAAGETSTKVTLTATANAKVGPAPFTLSAPGAAPVEATVVVAGQPGTFDASFDGDGLVLDPTHSKGRYDAVLELPDRSIVVAGATTDNLTGTWLVRRFLANGAADSDFDTAAAAAMPTSGEARGLAHDPATGRIVVVGTSKPNDLFLLTIVRLNADGSVDQSFANGGRFVASSVEHLSSTGAGAVVLGDSSIVVAGEASHAAFVQRYTAGGQKDLGWSTFSTTPNEGELSGIAVLPGGGFIAGGTSRATDPPGHLAVRLLADGKPDTAFDDDGVRTYANGCAGNTFAVTKGFDAILAGHVITNGAEVCTMRFAASETGAERWTRTTSVGSGGNFLGASGAGDGASYVGGFGGGVDRFGFMERRLDDGALDPAFGDKGVFRLEDVENAPDKFSFQFRAVTRTADGQVVIAGHRTGVDAGAFVVRVWE